MILRSKTRILSLSLESSVVEALEINGCEGGIEMILGHDGESVGKKGDDHGAMKMLEKEMYVCNRPWFGLGISLQELPVCMNNI